MTPSTKHAIYILFVILLVIYLGLKAFQLLVWALSPVSNMVTLFSCIVGIAVVIYGIGFYFGYMTNRRKKEEQIKSDFWDEA